MTTNEIYQQLGVSEQVLSFSEGILAALTDRFAQIDRNAEINQAKVIAAMQKNRVNATNFAATTGYGYDDEGRDNLERVYADTFHTEAALVRPQITCGTHALAIALSANLLPGDELLAISGKPYDTLEEVIGIRPSPCSLAEYGVTYRQVDLHEDGSFDLEGIKNTISEKTKLIHIQRSKGYCPRPTLSVSAIGEAIAVCKSVKPDVIVMVDNCYGEFVETIEPSDLGADMIVGSLIKNPGGGLAPIGGYICGTQKCVDRCAYRLSAPGLGQEVGANLGLMPALYQGFFLAPNVVSGALKGAILTAACYEKLGFRVVPSAAEDRHDIIQCVELGSEAGMVAFCKGIQAAAPVDSYVSPVPAPMPGYDAPVIMAAGAFVQGSSIELSADGPVRPPYAVYYQGGLTWYHAKLGVLLSLQKMLDAGLIQLP
ncbi:MAG: methionine gamma-lyase family protein [Eubacteriales bacterium]|nr:methionine gamma-lyase family protein [Eubacteriales bacterium]